MDLNGTLFKLFELREPWGETNVASVLHLEISFTLPVDSEIFSKSNAATRRCIDT